ncbi:hypothetical protein [Bryobacter aggregatus]|uniref:hypothetical protein n=1 Tax=Bryobacter aggregatus TaxID=360054 RepID=UPI0004E1DD63|nr:hypothetical protein [Bryobacter aggregatus]
MKILCGLLLGTLVWAQTAILPNEYATKGGSTYSNYPFSGYPSTLQFIYAESLVLGAGIKPGDVITGMQMRMRSGQAGGPPRDFTYNNWDVTLSKSTRAVGNLTSFIPGNQASDAVAVRRGKLFMPANSMPSDKLVNNFGLYIPFTTGYPYTGGDLLLQITHDVGDWDGSHQIDSASDASTMQHIAVLRYNTANTDQSYGDALVLQLSYTRQTTGPLLTATGILNAASYGANAVAPGEIVTLYGDRLGQTAVVSANVNNGRFQTVAGGTRLLFDGVAAPMIYSSTKQLAAIVPYAVASKATTSIVAEVDGVKSTPVAMPVVNALPGIFTVDASGKGQAAVLNENGTLNGAANPAAVGSIIVIYLTGEGLTNPVVEDGLIASGPSYAKPVLPVSVTVGNLEAEVLYAGAAPASVAGLMQINARVSAAAAPVANSPLLVRIGDRTSQAGVTVALR